MRHTVSEEKNAENKKRGDLDTKVGNIHTGQLNYNPQATRLMDLSLYRINFLQVKLALISC